jgi:hypothetical protein
MMRHHVAMLAETVGVVEHYHRPHDRGHAI